jgi:hypothetical protein
VITFNYLPDIHKDCRSGKGSYETKKENHDITHCTGRYAGLYTGIFSRPTVDRSIKDTFENIVIFK